MPSTRQSTKETYYTIEYTNLVDGRVPDGVHWWCDNYVKRSTYEDALAKAKAYYLGRRYAYRVKRVTVITQVERNDFVVIPPPAETPQRPALLRDAVYIGTDPSVRRSARFHYYDTWRSAAVGGLHHYL